MPAKPAILAAGAFAALGVAAIAYTTISGAKTHKPQPAASVRTAQPDRPSAPQTPQPTDGATTPDIAATPTPTAPEPAPNFPPSSTPEQLDAILASLESHIAQLTPATTDVSAMGVDASSKLAPAAKIALEPFLHGSGNKIIDMVRALGGTPPEISENAGPVPGSGLFALLQNASIDFNQAELLPRVINGRDLEREEMNSRMGQQGAVGASGRPIPGTNAPPAPGETPTAPAERNRETVMKMIPGNLFPDVHQPAEKKLNVIEVRAPILFAGEKPSSSPAKLGIQLAWNPAVKNWQIAAFQIYGADPATISSRMRPPQ